MTNKQVTNPSLPIDKNAILFGTCSTHTHTHTTVDGGAKFLADTQGRSFCSWRKGGGGGKNAKNLGNQETWLRF